MRKREIIKNKTVMWSKIKTLSEDEGYNKSKIARILGIHRETVRKYLSMSESEYFKWLDGTGNRTRKLDVYMPFVKSQLERDATLSAAAIHDRLKENFPTLPEVSEKTVYNMVERCRKTYGLSKHETPEPRQYERRDESGYGEYVSFASNSFKCAKILSLGYNGHILVKLSRERDFISRCGEKVIAIFLNAK